MDRGEYDQDHGEYLIFRGGRNGHVLEPMLEVPAQYGVDSIVVEWIGRICVFSFRIPVGDPRSHSADHNVSNGIFYRFSSVSRWLSGCVDDVETEST